MAGWSKLTQAELRTLLRSHGQPTNGSKAALVQRLAAFLSDDSKADSDCLLRASQSNEVCVSAR
jgi:hypothetical protein